MVIINEALDFTLLYMKFLKKEKKKKKTPMFPHSIIRFFLLLFNFIKATQSVIRSAAVHPCSIHFPTKLGYVGIYVPVVEMR